MKTMVRASFFLLIFTLGYMQPFFMPAGQRLTPTDLVFPLAAFIFFVAILLGAYRFKWHSFYLVLAVYFVTMVISAVFSEDVKGSFIKLIPVTYLLGLPVLAYNVIEDERDLKWTFYALICGAFLPLAAGLLTIAIFYVQPDNSLLKYTVYEYGAVPVGNYPRLSATFVSASMFCNYLSVIAVIMLIANRVGWLTTKIFLPLFAAVLICSAFTISAGLGGLVLVIGGWIWLTQRESKKLIARGSLVGSVTFAVLFFAINFFALQPYEGAPYKINIPGVERDLYPSGRVLIWEDSINSFKRDPITGIGLGQNPANVTFQNTDGSVSLLTDAHNTFLSIAAQCGIIGLAAIIWLMVFFVRQGVAARTGSLILSGLVLAYISAFIYQGLLSSFEDTRHLWVLMGMIPAVRVMFEAKNVSLDEA